MSKFVATRNFIYGDRERCIGEVFERQNQRWDEKLKERGTVVMFEGTEKSLVHCDTCGRDFNGQHSYDNHIVKHSELDKPKVRVDPIKKMEELHPEGIHLQYQEPIPADVALS